MRIAILTNSKTADGLVCKLGILPDPSCFPVTFCFDKSNVLNAIHVDSIDDGSKEERIERLRVTASILDNFATLVEKNELSPTPKADKFATAIEERHGRQVVKHGEKIITIGRVKDKAEGAKQWAPVVNGRRFDHKDFVIDAENENEAKKKMQIRFVNEAAGDKKLAVLIGPWLADDSKVVVLESELPKNVIDLHDFK